MEQTVTTSTTKGIVISLILIVIALAAFFLDIDPKSGFQYISYVIFIAGIIGSVTYYGKQIDHNATFGNYFAHGFKVAALVTCIMIIYIVIFILLFPDFKERALEKITAAMREKKLPEDQIAAYVGTWKKLFMVLAIAGTLVGYLIFGALASLIGAGVTKKNPHTFEG